jgi:pyridoxal phosphate enzyme (YggS family)
MSAITERVRDYLVNIPNNVLLVAATKTRTPDEVREAVDAGLKACGENYVQEAEPKIAALGRAVQWHCIGHLQSNKIRKAVELFDMIETIDSLAAAKEVEKRCAPLGKVMEILLEVNIAEEKQKNGILPRDLPGVVESIRREGFGHVRLSGLMTMGPFLDDPERIRPWFRKAAALFRDLRTDSFRHLSMGMSDSWRVAVEEGATIVRIGTAIFGPRPPRK